ncbi:MAG TPA: hypothetical protein VMV00_03035 [Candidatus Baltobacteraceae bacterium]|nr:hypothetical protein [Candidatus Baltobacteraceae bacterium]
MDHSTQTEVKQAEEENSDFEAYVTEDGKKYHVPYRMIKKLIFSNVSKEELKDIQHSARLQYRLMLMDPVIKANVNFTKRIITILYNPKTADNIREKTSKEELMDFLAKQGVNVDTKFMVDEDYDYYKNLYTYAYMPPKIRETTPYGYTKEEWLKLKDDWEVKMQKGEEAKLGKHRAWQDSYLEANPEIQKAIAPDFKPTVAVAGKTSLLGGLLGKKPSAKKKEKGFWFHGI